MYGLSDDESVGAAKPAKTGIALRTAADIFGGTGLSDDSGMDTDEMISKAKAAPIATSRLKKKSASAAGSFPDADADEDEDTEAGRERKKKRLEDALKKKKRKEEKALEKEAKRAAKKKRKADKKAAKQAAIDSGVPPPTDYDSGDSYDSGGEGQRTKEDDDFLDMEDDDEDLLEDYNKEQNFDDERPDGYVKKAKKKRSRADDDDDEGKSSKRGSKMSEEDMKNPMMIAMNKMKVRKIEKRSLEQKEEIATTCVREMDEKAAEDEASQAAGQLGLAKLKFLPSVVKILGDFELHRALIETGILQSVGRWIEPLPNGKLGNVTIRGKLLELVSSMNGENGVNSEDLKRSGIGKIVMKLYKHKEETVELKRLMRSMIETWSRPIYKKSKNLKELVNAQHDSAESGFLAKSVAQVYSQKLEEKLKKQAASSGKVVARDGGAGAVLSGETVKSSGDDGGTGRVSIPFSRGFQYTIRPANKVDAETEAIMATTKVRSGGAMERLNKRMIEKNGPVVKNERSEKMSVEGRAVK
jgi:transcription factor SPN1